jgi:hypothetical protein
MQVSTMEVEYRVQDVSGMAARLRAGVLRGCVMRFGTRFPHAAVWNVK